MKDGVGDGVRDVLDDVDDPPPPQPMNVNIPITISSHTMNGLLRITEFPRENRLLFVDG